MQSPCATARNTLNAKINSFANCFGIVFAGGGCAIVQWFGPANSIRIVILSEAKDLAEDFV